MHEKQFRKGKFNLQYDWFDIRHNIIWYDSQAICYIEALSAFQYLQVSLNNKHANKKFQLIFGFLKDFAYLPFLNIC